MQVSESILCGSINRWRMHAVCQLRGFFCRPFSGSLFWHGWRPRDESHASFPLASDSNRPTPPARQDFKRVVRSATPRAHPRLMTLLLSAHRRPCRPGRPPSLLSHSHSATTVRGIFCTPFLAQCSKHGQWVVHSRIETWSPADCLAPVNQSRISNPTFVLHSSQCMHHGAAVRRESSMDSTDPTGAPKLHTNRDVRPPYSSAHTHH